MGDEKSTIKNVDMSLVDYWMIIFERRKIIGRFVLAIVILTIIISLFMKDIYAAKAIIIPIAPKEARTGSIAAGIMQQVGGLPGVSLPESSSTAEIVTLLKSNILREKVINQYNLLPVLFHDQWNAKTKKWKTRAWYNPMFLISSFIRFVKHDDNRKNKNSEGVPDIWDGLRALDDMVVINNNVKDKTITIAVEFDDPVIAADIVGYFIAALNDHMSSEARRVALTNRNYLEQQLYQTPDPFIKQNIYNLIAQQIETSMMAEVKENFAFKVIDPPKAPDRKIKPKRTKIVLVSFLVSLLICVLLAIFQGYWKKIKEQNTPQYGG